MNAPALRRHVALGLLVIVLGSWIAGCTGAGPASTRGTGRARCGSGSSTDDQRPLFFIFCVESP